MYYKKIRRNKTPGSDGIGWEFYKTNWSIIKEDLHDILNEMYIKNTVTAQQKHGLIVCLSKYEGAQKPTDFRPITLLNVDYKILAKILANRLRPLIEEHLQKNQFCGVPGNTILDALATVRNTTAFAEIKKTPMCIVSLDFQEAFDRISHTYLATILRSYGLSEWFVDRIRNMYEEAYSSVSINGHISGPIPIRCGIRQGCPLSMILFAMCIHPFLQMLDRNLSGVQLQRTIHRTAVIAYADDVTVLRNKTGRIPNHTRYSAMV
jgi:hypothetical protein